jgi:hypothetical protein
MKFRKKPVEIEAVQFTGSNINFLVQDFIHPDYKPCGDDSVLIIETLEGEFRADPGRLDHQGHERESFILVKMRFSS